MTAAIPGDVDYGKFGAGYATQRRADRRIAARIHQALGDARTVLNVGAGAGSYEPEDREVIAIEPSEAMRAQRPKHLAQAIDAIAEQLPLVDRSVDASMALVTVHQWRDLNKGIAELRRVTRGPIVVLTFDGDALDRYWLAHYAPELISVERGRYPKNPKALRCAGPLNRSAGRSRSHRLHRWLHRSVLCTPRSISRPGCATFPIRLEFRPGICSIAFH
jgi:SAM-dependent methyltransferase